jgi:hypothetical protein
MLAVSAEVCVELRGTEYGASAFLYFGVRDKDGNVEFRVDPDVRSPIWLARKNEHPGTASSRELHAS